MTVAEQPRDPPVAVSALFVLPLSYADPWATAVFVDELDARYLQCCAYFIACVAPAAQRTVLRLQALYCGHRNICFIRKLLL